MIKKSDFEQIITPAEIATKVQQIGADLSRCYQGKELTLIMVMKGALCLVADLMRHVSIPCTIDFIQASSYGLRGCSAGALHLWGVENLSLKDKNVLLVDDIYDTGATMTQMIADVHKQGPRSLQTLVLLLKKKPRSTSYFPDYHLFEIDDSFVVGYGLDYQEHYRGLPGIYRAKSGASLA